MFNILTQPPRPQVQPVTLLYSILKGEVPLSYSVYCKTYSLNIPTVLKNTVTAATGSYSG